MSRMQLAWNAIKGSMQYVAGGGVVALSAFVMYPHLWGLKRYKKVFQMYRDGEPEPVDADSKRIAQQIFDTVLWDPTSEANVDLFTVFGQDIIHHGSTFSRYGGIVGIPVIFKYRSVVDVEKEKMTLSNQQIDWDSPAGKYLLDSLVLSEKSRRFAITRELFYLHTYHAHVQGLLVGISGICAYWMGAVTSAAYNLQRRLPTASRVVVYSFFAGIGATLHCFASDNYNWYRDRKVDRKASELGLDYAEGGVEFYNKLLQRNMALRSMMGPDGNKRYTAYGNDIHFWRSPNVPLTSRRDMLLAAVQSMQESAMPQETSQESTDKIAAS